MLQAVEVSRMNLSASRRRKTIHIAHRQGELRKLWGSHRGFLGIVIKKRLTHSRNKYDQSVPLGDSEQAPDRVSPIRFLLIPQVTECRERRYERQDEAQNTIQDSLF